MLHRRVFVGLATASLFAVLCVSLAACSRDSVTERDKRTPRLGAQVPVASDLQGRIAFNTKLGDIWTMDADGGNRRRITVSGADTHFDPSWSSNGRAIVYRRDSDNDQIPPNGIGLDGIEVVNIASGRSRALQPPTGGLFPDWSPRGNMILFSGVKQAQDEHDSIWVVRPNGRGLHRLSTQQAECGEWSPNARQILYCSQPGTGDFETWVMDADGSHRRQLTGSKGINTGAIWSPDGQQVAFSSTRDGSSELYVMDADGSHQTRVIAAPSTDETPDAWLPGMGVVFASFSNEALLPRWFVVRADSSHLRSLPHLRGAMDPLDWQI